MPNKTYQIRVCTSCGLRYPLTEDHPFGERCPICLGTTRIIASHPLRTESGAPFNEPSIHLEILLDNVRSAWNVGSVFRTADGFGLRHIHLCGITPTPEVDSVKKTSLGAEMTVPWTYSKNAVQTAEDLKSSGYRLLALEEDARSIPVQDAKAKLDIEKAVLMAGNEITGVDPDLLRLCDEIFFIPMRGNKKSFNVAVAFAIAVSQIIP